MYVILNSDIHRKGSEIMWNRKELKAIGKQNFHKNYWKSVLVGVIYSLFFIGTSSTMQRKSEDITNQIDFSDPEVVTIIVIILGIIGTLLTILGLIRIFLLNPLEVGCNRFFLVNQDDMAGMGELGYSFKNNYFKAVVGLLLRDLLIIVGLILFIIPGLILTYSYRMVPYILSEDPTISATEALKKSRAMMKGNKWRCFVFDLSFILWDLLSAITVGIVGLFYVTPYKLNSEAALYKAIRG